MTATYRRIWELLSRPERHKFLLLMFATIVMSVFEVIGVGMILPFLSVVATPRLFETNEILQWFVVRFSFETTAEATIGLGCCVFGVIVLGTLIRAAVTYLQFRFALMRSYTLASRLLHGYLSQDYVWYVSRNSSDMATTLLAEVDQVIRESILPAVLLVSNLLVTALIGALIFVVAPGVALGMTGLLVVVYAIVFLTLRNRMAEIGRKRVEVNRSRFLAVREISGGLKEIKVMGIEGESLNRFRTPALLLAGYQTTSQVMMRLPRFALEAAVYGGFVLMVLLMVVRRGDNATDLLPLFGLLGMSATRLFPAMQNIYQYLGQMRLSGPALNRVLTLMIEAERRDLPVVQPKALPLREGLAFDTVRFQYPGADQPTLKGLSLDVPARATIGLVGGTGAGKTTVIDLVLGLLSPDGGAMRIDGVPLTDENRRAWQRNVGYVPQQLFLLDDTVAANIAFGSGQALDMAAVERAARMAALHDFITQELREGYATRVGEHGVRLSGGQRQRIGIARALYRDPDVLILDEATSALDNLTEKAVMEAVRNLTGNKTIIMIAHRLSTVRDCDKIYLLERGALAAAGSYDALVAESAQFRELAAE